MQEIPWRVTVCVCLHDTLLHAPCTGQGGHISEAVRTEMHFMYTDTNKELFSEDVKDHNGFGKDT